MIKAMGFDFKGGFSQDSKIVIDEEYNIEKRIKTLCSHNYDCGHSEPHEVPLEEINIQELTAKDIVSLVKLGTSEQYEEQFNRFQLKDNEVDQCDTACTPLDVEAILADFAKLYDDFTSGKISVEYATNRINRLKFIRYIDIDEPVQETSSDTKTSLDIVPGFSVMDEHDHNKCIGTINFIDLEADKVIYTDIDTKELVTVNFSDIKDRTFPF